MIYLSVLTRCITKCIIRPMKKTTFLRNLPSKLLSLSFLTALGLAACAKQPFNSALKPDSQDNTSLDSQESLSCEKYSECFEHESKSKEASTVEANDDAPSSDVSSTD